MFPCLIKNATIRVVMREAPVGPDDDDTDDLLNKSNHPDMTIE